MCVFQDDVSLNGYQKYLVTQSSPAPLTAAEEELRQIKISEVLHLGMSAGDWEPNVSEILWKESPQIRTYKEEE